MNKFLFIFMCFLSSCIFSQDLDFKLKQDIGVRVEGSIIDKVSKEEMEFVIDSVDANLELIHPKIYNRKKVHDLYKDSNFVIEVFKSPFECAPDSERLCGGLQYEWGAQYSYYGPDDKGDEKRCIVQMALAHEWIHFLNFSLGRFDDYNHQNIEYYPHTCPGDDADCYNNSALAKINKDICQKYCIELCR